MQYEYSYINLVDRQEKVIEAEGLGYRMLHDTFDPDWNSGDEPHGIMIFTDEPSPSPGAIVPFVPLNPVTSIAERVSYIEDWLLARFGE